MRIVLISTYELGRQPFGLASPAAWLRAEGHQVTCADVSVNALPSLPIREADLVAFYLPMHTATRLAVEALGRVRALNSQARLCAYGLYAPLNEDYLRSLGVDTILGGEFEPGLVRLASRESARSNFSLERLQFRVPDRSTLPALTRYAQLMVDGEKRIAGYTEASRGCKHLCRHCPVTPIYNGAFRVIQAAIVIEDVRQQVSAGARHITFGDPDFFNGPSHARRIVERLHAEFPSVTYDVTIKIEHLLNHAELLPVLKETGCLFVTSAVESLDDEVLLKLEKGHKRADFVEVAQRFRDIGLALAPTFIPFTPWTTREGYRDLLRTLCDLDLIPNVSPVQLALRLLITAGSRLLELDDIREVILGFDEPALLHRWKHPDPAMDRLAAGVLTLVNNDQKQARTRSEIFGRIWELAWDERLYENYSLVPRAAIPYMDEPWYC